MNLKNKILLTLIAIIFVICLFNTNCFAFTINDGDKIVELPDFDDLKATYQNNVGDEPFCTVIYKKGSTYMLCFSKTGSGFPYYSNNTGSYGAFCTAAQTSYYLNGSYGWKQKYDFHNNSASSGSFDNASSDSRITFLYSTVDIYDYPDNNLLIASSVVERGTDGDDTNPDSGETGNETVGGDIETDTDSDDSTGILSSITQGFKNVINFFTQLVDFVGNILSYLNPFSDNFILKGVLDFLVEILSYINPFSENFFVYKLIDLLGDLLEFLFIPNENSFTGIIDIVKSKFDFIDTIKISANSLKDLISNVGTAPKLTINVNNNKYGVNQVTLIDLEWYKPYKTYGDIVLTGFIYAFFLWRLFISIPNILHGFGGSVQDSYKITEIKGGKD